MSAGATVTQDARNAASKCVRYLTGNTFAAVDIAQGRSDRSAIVETFARFETEIRLATAAEFAAREAALVDAATALASDVQELIDCRGDCGEWGSECPLQDAHKPDSTIDRLQRLLDVLAARAHTTSEAPDA